MKLPTLKEYLIELSDIDVGKQLDVMMTSIGDPKKPSMRNPAQRAKMQAKVFKDERASKSDNPTISRLDKQIALMKQKLAKMLEQREQLKTQVQKQTGQPGQQQGQQGELK